jgi:hypothetical protein
MFILGVLPARREVEQVDAGQPAQLLIGGAPLVGAGLLVGHDGGFLDHPGPGDRGQAHASPAAGSALPTSEFGGIGAATGEDPVTVGRCKQALGLGDDPTRCRP